MDLLALLHRLNASKHWLIALCLIIAGSPPPLRAGEHHLSKIPPSMEIEVLDPRADPMSRPAIELETDCDGNMQVDIPRPVLVHKLYYTGDRSFQAELLPGGPVIIVVTHPRTQERCYLETQLPPGAPRIYYKGRSIEYDYGNQGVCISFPLFGDPKVTYRNGVSIKRKTSEAAHVAVRHTAHAIAQTGIPERVGEVAQGTGALVRNTAVYAGGFGERLVAPVVAVAKSTPLGSLVKRDPAKEAEHARKLADRKQQHHEDVLSETVPAVR